MARGINAEVTQIEMNIGSQQWKMFMTIKGESVQIEITADKAAEIIRLFGSFETETTNHSIYYLFV